MELLAQKRYEESTLQHIEIRLESLEDDYSEDAKFERHIAEHERSSVLRKLGAIDQAIHSM